MKFWHPRRLTGSVGKKIGLHAAVVAAALCAVPAASLAVDIDCEILNAENIGLGLANSNGYSPGANSAGDWAFPTTTITLPPNGILCYRRITCQTSYRVMTFLRNAANTPVYLLAENDIQLNQTGCHIDVSGGNASTTYGIGYDRLGGLAGPGGSDGGSCDFTFSGSPRAGEGIGPGGGKAAAGAAGGGGASPVEAGGAGTGGSAGGLAYSDPTHRLLHGGSGGGCGSDSDNNPWGAGGGGGGVIVLAAKNLISLNGTNSQVTAVGGTSANYGGGGGGGVIRLISAEVNGIGYLTVTGSASASCGTTGTSSGGCGGDGVVKIEAASVSGSFLSNIGPPDAVYYGPEAPIFPPTAQKPVLEISSVTATWNGVGDTVTPAHLNPSLHVHRNAGVFLEAPSPSGQNVVVTLTSNNVPSDATVHVKMNSVGTAAITGPATTAGTGSGALTWTATLTVPSGMELGTIEAWIDNVCTSGCP